MIMRHRCLAILCVAFPTLLVAQTAPNPEAQTERGPSARIAIMRALDERHMVRLGGWLHSPPRVAQAGQGSVCLVQLLRGYRTAQFWGCVAEARVDDPPLPLRRCPAIYEFLPSLSRGTGVPTPTPRAEYVTVELNYDAGKAFEAALAGEQPKLQSETLWYRLVVSGNTPCYVRLRPRASLASILDERADGALPETVKGLISKITIETLNLRPNMLVNVAPMIDH